MALLATSAAPGVKFPTFLLDRKRCDIETGLAFIPWFSGKLPTTSNFKEKNLWRKPFYISIILGGRVYIDKFINQTIWKIQCDRYFPGNSGRFLFSIRASSKLSPNWDADVSYSREKIPFSIMRFKDVEDHSLFWRLPFCAVCPSTLG